MSLHRSVRSNRFERTRAFPGGELIPEAIGSLTQAVTIRRPRGVQTQATGEGLTKDYEVMLDRLGIKSYL